MGVLLHNDRYLTRLWCIFELATFSFVRNNNLRDCFELWPVWMSPASFAFAFCWVFVLVAGAFARPFVGGAFVGPAFAMLFLIFFSAATCKLVFQKRLCVRLLETFDVKKANCFSEDDRRNIEEFIRALWAGHNGNKDGLDAFNTYVHSGLVDFFKTRLFILSHARFFLPPFLIFAWCQAIILSSADFV